MGWVSVRGLDVHFRDEGAGVALLLGHSSTASGGQWKELFHRLSSRYRLIAPDHAGYGRTPLPSGETPVMEQEIAIVEALVGLTSEPVHFVGHSYGGSILARAAVRMPERVRSLTLFEPTLFYLLAASGRTAEHAEIKEVADRVIRLVGANDPDEAARGFIAYWVGNGAYDAMDDRRREAIRAGMAKLRIEWPAAFEPLGATMEALSALTMPVQLLSGSRSTAAARAVVGVLRQLWPDAPYAEIDGAGHMAPVTHAGTVNEIIDTFVSSH